MLKSLYIKNYIEDIIFKKDKTKYIKDKIKVLINQGDVEEAKQMISEIKKEETVFDIDILFAKIILLVLDNKLQEAKKLSEKYMKWHPFNLDLLCNRAYIYELLGEYQLSVDTYIRALKVVKDDNDKSDIIDSIRRIKELDSSVDDSQLNVVDYRMFPLKINDKETYIGEGLFKNKKGEGYFSQYYNETVLAYPASMWAHYKTETLYGEKYICENYETIIKSDSILPISYKNKIKIFLDDNEYEFENTAPNRYNYFNIKEGTKVKIESKSEYILGKPIELQQKKKNDVKLVLCLFADGLSQKLIDKEGLQEVMPNTYKFFSKGSILTNFHSHGEWTFPSIASVYTGQYPINHGLYHPTLPYVLAEGYPIMSEYFKDAGYLTFQSCGDWRKAPTYGYVKGFDRSVYQSSMQGMKIESVLQAFLEQMRSFPNRDKFMWLTLFELHHMLNRLPDISNQIVNSIESHDYTKTSDKSVYKDYDENDIEIYTSELKRMDFYMKIIYDYIEENYRNDEILVSLMSDHGQSYLTKDKYLLSDARTHVPFMIRGKDVPVGISDVNAENIDILPTLLKSADINFDEDSMDGAPLISPDGLKDKKYTYSESRFPDKTYKAIVRDNQFEFKFESKDNILDDGRISIDDFEYILYDKKTKKVINECEDEVIKKFLDIVMDHIKYNINV